MHCTRRRIACTTHTCHLWPLVRSPVVLRPVGPADIGEWQPWRELLTLRRSLAELVAEARRHVLHAGTCARRRPPSCGGVDIPWRPMMHANAVMQSARAHLLGFHRHNRGVDTKARNAGGMTMLTLSADSEVVRFGTGYLS